MKDEYPVQSTGARARGERAAWRALLRYAARASKCCGLSDTPPRPTRTSASAGSCATQWKYFFVMTMSLSKNIDHEVSASSVEELERLTKEIAREWGISLKIKLPWKLGS